jgi:hypothetical protein
LLVYRVRHSLVVSRRLKPPAVLRMARRAAHRCGLQVEEKPGRGKGSHRIFVVLDADGAELARFAITGHSREVSWTVLRTIEKALEPLYGAQWVEDR